MHSVTVAFGSCNGHYRLTYTFWNRTRRGLQCLQLIRFQFLKCNTRHRDGASGKVTSSLLNPGSSKRFLPTPKRPGWLCDPICLLFGRYWGLFPGNKSVGVCCLPLSSVSRTSILWWVRDLDKPLVPAYRGTNNLNTLAEGRSGTQIFRYHLVTTAVPASYSGVPGLKYRPAVGYPNSVCGFFFVNQKKFNYIVLEYDKTNT
jgi:hypothetical protein